MVALTFAAAVAALVSGAELRICVVLGVNNGTVIKINQAGGAGPPPHHHSHHLLRTSDQEWWATNQAEADIAASLAAAGSPYSLALDRFYAGADPDSTATTAAIAGFAANCSARGAGAFVGE